MSVIPVGRIIIPLLLMGCGTLTQAADQPKPTKEESLLGRYPQLEGMLEVLAPAKATSSISATPPRHRQIVVSTAGQEPWQVSWKMPIPVGLDTGEVVRLTARVRCTAGRPGRAGLHLIADTKPSVITLGYNASSAVSSEWMPLAMVVVIPRRLEPGIAVISLSVGDQVQTIEVGTVSAMRIPTLPTTAERQQLEAVQRKTGILLTERSLAEGVLRLAAPARMALTHTASDAGTAAFLRLRVDAAADEAWKGRAVWTVKPALRAGTRVTIQARLRCVSGGSGRAVLDWKERNSASGWLAGMIARELDARWHPVSTSVVLDRDLAEGLTELVLAVGDRLQTIDFGDLRMLAEEP